MLETQCVQKKCDWSGQKLKKHSFKVETNLYLKKHNGDAVKKVPQKMKKNQTRDKCIGSLFSIEFILTTITFLLILLVFFAERQKVSFLLSSDY